MASRWSEALGSINTYVDELAKAKETKKAAVTLATFDSSATTLFEIIRDSAPVKSWEKVTDKDATPRGGTPLFDAIGKLMARAEADKPEKASIVIMTDGHENASREMSRDAAKATLDRARGKGWPVIFMGADFDAMSQASSVGTQFGQTLNARLSETPKAEHPDLTKAAHDDLRARCKAANCLPYRYRPRDAMPGRVMTRTWLDFNRKLAAAAVAAGLRRAGVAVR